MITEEGRFSASTIADNTEICLMDEWGDKSMSADLAKQVLQGTFVLRLHVTISYGVRRHPWYTNRHSFSLGREYITMDEEQGSTIMPPHSCHINAAPSQLVRHITPTYIRNEFF